MQIWLHQLDGSSQSMTVEELKELLLEETSRRVVAQGAHLNLENLEELLFEGANAWVTGDLEGGKKKKKKKVYTTKKKGKHIHKHVKMGIYNLYSVDGTFSTIQAKATSPSSARPVLPAALEPSWPSTGIATTAAFVTQPLRWTPRQSRRTRKS